jgi:preprotein translocase subunit SecE
MARVSPGEFIRQVRTEADKVTWPTRKETWSATLLVLLMTTVLSIFFLGVDQVLGRLVRAILNFFMGL